MNEALKYLEKKYNVETRYFSARGKHLNFYIHCDYCVREHICCIHKDDMQQWRKSVSIPSFCNLSNTLLISIVVFPFFSWTPIKRDNIHDSSFLLEEGQCLKPVYWALFMTYPLAFFSLFQKGL